MDVIDSNWIKARMTGKRGEQARLAEAMGIDNDKMSKVLRGDRRVQPEEIPAVLKFFGDQEMQTTIPGFSEDTRVLESLIPVYSVDASAGGGSVVLEEEVTHSLAFPAEYLKKLTSSQMGDLAIISVKGDSMEPTLLDDDVVLLDLSKTNLSFDGLFVLRFDDALHVKRIGRSGRKDHVTILSDNRDIYPPIEAPTKDITPVGKVLWYGRKV